MRTRQERQVDKAMAFRQCPFCAYDLATGEGERGCHYYDCPYLPDMLDVVCPDCQHNFYTGEGETACGGSPSCDFARNEAPSRVATLRSWLELHGQMDAGATGQPLQQIERRPA